ncbi:MAG TPA: histidine phosphatase family protein [Lacisediminihabitans sp.]|nr:histidine phosphatase family protein [Lacisediminihabitans sp.]HXD60660.1 histidine phosphatase family protein [Lacisediminihabitans sp.]
MRLLLIRHAQTPANVLGQLDTGRPGPGLTRLGQRQASEIPVALGDGPIAAIFASPLVRTQLTAEPLSASRGLDVRVLEGLQEIEAGSLEKRSDRASVRRYLETVFAWGSGKLDVRMPGGTDGHAFFERFDADIGRAASAAVHGPTEEPPTAAVFSHGAAIRVWTAARVSNVPPEFAATHELDNTGVVELAGSPDDGWTLLSWAGLPVGGPQLIDQQAEDPTGEPL